jgi:hypothetical protein
MQAWKANQTILCGALKLRSIPNLSDSKCELLKADKMVNQSMRGAATFCDLSRFHAGLPDDENPVISSPDYE